MSVAFVGLKESGYAAATSAEITAAQLTAAGIAAGNTLIEIAWLERTGKAIAVSNTSGTIGAQQENGGASQAAFYTTSWASTASKMTWAESASTGRTLGVLAFSGVDPITPIDVNGGWTNMAAAETITVPSIKTVTPGAYQIVYVLDVTGTEIGSTPEGWTRLSNFCITRPIPTAGATATQSVPMASKATGSFLTFALRLKGSTKTAEVSDSMTPSESLTKKLTKAITESTTPAEAYAKTLKRGLTDSATPTESYGKTLKKPLTEVSSPIETWTVRLVAPEPAPPSAVCVAHEYAPDELAVRVIAPDGRRSRWAADEPQAENVITGLRLAGTIPGGDKEMGGVLARNPRVAWPDLAPFSDITVYGRGVSDVGNFRLEKAPENDSDQMSIAPAAVGYSSLLEDDQAVLALGFIASLLAAWVGPGSGRRKQLINESRPHQQDASVVWVEAEGAALHFEVQDAWASPTIPCCEAWFDAGSAIRIARLEGEWENGDPNTAFELGGSLCDDELGSGAETSGDIYGATSGRFALVPTSPHRFAAMDWRYSATNAGVAGAQFAVDVSNLKVIGDHGLELQGEWPHVGYRVAQMLEWAIPRFTGLKAEPGDLEDLGYIVQNAWYQEPTSMAAVVADLTKYELLDWFVRGDKRFRLKRPRSYGRRWRASASRSGLEEAGLDASRLWRSIVVAYQDVDGTTRTVGPPGSGAMVETESLEITDPRHPAVQANVKPRNDLLTLNDTATAARAIEAGEIWLAESFELSHSGSAKLSRYVLDDRMVLRPVSEVREGDEICFPDAADPSYRKIAGRDYDHDSRTVTVDLDAPPEGLQALLERMQAEIQSLQLT